MDTSVTGRARPSKEHKHRLYFELSTHDRDSEKTGLQ